MVETTLRSALRVVLLLALVISLSAILTSTSYLKDNLPDVDAPDWFNDLYENTTLPDFDAMFKGNTTITEWINDLYENSTLQNMVEDLVYDNDNTFVDNEPERKNCHLHRGKKNNFSVPLTTEDTQHILSDMDVSESLSCGHYKCFVPSISDRCGGYLVEKTTNTTYHAFRAWELMSWVDQNIREGMHLYDGEPFPLKLDETVGEAVFHGVTDAIGKVSGRKRKELPSHLRGQTVAVQKVRKAPKGTLQFACWYENYDKFKIKRVDFMDRVHRNGNITEFRRNFVDGHGIVKKVLKAKANPYVFDLQLLVDPMGHLFFIDPGAHPKSNDTSKAMQKYCRVSKHANVTNMANVCGRAVSVCLQRLKGVIPCKNKDCSE